MTVEVLWRIHLGGHTVNHGNSGIVNGVTKHARKNGADLP